jgi:hypothetical protein
MLIDLYLFNFSYYSEEGNTFDIQLSNVFDEYCVISSSNYFHCRLLERNEHPILYITLKYYIF